MKAGKLGRELLDLFLPRGCLACGDRIPPEADEGMVCGWCRSRFRPPPPPFCPRCQHPKGTRHPGGEACLECADWPRVVISARSAAVLDETTGGVVHALKYGGWRDLAPLMARRMVPLLPVHGREPLLIPVPTTPWRERLRGYNQAGLLAEQVGEMAGLPLARVLRREGGGTQVRLGPRARHRNVRGAFALAESSRSLIRGREVILIDDVLTTGATAMSAAEALATGGVESVRLLTFARSLPYSEEGRRTPVGTSV